MMTSRIWLFLLGLLLTGCFGRDQEIPPTPTAQERIFQLSPEDKARAAVMVRDRHHLKIAPNATADDQPIVRRAQEAIRDGDDQAAIAALRQLAVKGYVDAQLTLFSFLPTPAKLARPEQRIEAPHLWEGYDWVKRSADAGYAPAQMTWAIATNQGKWGIDVDNTEAFRQASLAALQGYPLGMDMLTMLYVRGEAGYSSKIESLKWALLTLPRVPEDNSPISTYQLALRHIYNASEDLSASDFAEAQRRAQVWEADHPDAAKHLDEWRRQYFYALRPPERRPRND